MHGAVIVSPNYRLLPEARGLDILEDMRAFWAWMDAGSAQRYLDGMDGSIKLDASRTLLVGESAGKENSSSDYFYETDTDQDQEAILRFSRS